MAKGSLRVNGIIVDTDGEITASTGDSIVIREDDGSAVITVDTNGNVGINTTAPGAQFDIRGPAGTGSASASVLRMSTAETSVEDADQLGRIEFIAPLEAGGTDAILVGASIHAEADDTFAADNNATELVFSTGASEAAAEKMRITSDGKVGIGTTSPQAALHIVQSITNQLRIEGSGPTTYFKETDGNADENYQLRLSNGSFLFQTNNDAFDSASTKVAIDQSGNVGIGVIPETDWYDATWDVIQIGDNSSLVGIKGDVDNINRTILSANAKVTTNNVTTGWKRINALSASQLLMQDDDIIFRQAATSTADSAITWSEAMRIDGSGNVGIGTTSPQDLLHIAAANPVLRIENTDDSGVGAIEFWDAQSGTSQVGLIRYDDVSNSFQIQGNANGIRFLDPSNTFPNTTEAMRIDSSGNLMVAKTSTGIGNDGIELRADNAAYFTRSSATPIFINRNTSDGTIIDFRKDNSTVGSIATQFGDLIVGTGVTGLRFVDGNDEVIPRNTTGDVSDGTTSLGNSAARFNDLFLSGGIYLGGTGSANFLDDYEEGTWSPTITADGGTGNVSSSGSFGTIGGNYTKIGNMVFCEAQINLGSKTAVSNYLLVTNTPFNPSSNASYRNFSGNNDEMPTLMSRRNDSGGTITNGRVASSGGIVLGGITVGQGGEFSLSFYFRLT